MTDYNATAAFNWVLSGLTTCIWASPRRLECLCTTYCNPWNSTWSQVLVPLQNLLEMMRISLSVDRESCKEVAPLLQYTTWIHRYLSFCTPNMGFGASFLHQISGETIQDFSVQYVDDKLQFLNLSPMDHLWCKLADKLFTLAQEQPYIMVKPIVDFWRKLKPWETLYLSFFTQMAPPY